MYFTSASRSLLFYCVFSFLLFIYLSLSLPPSHSLPFFLLPTPLVLISPDRYLETTLETSCTFATLATRVSALFSPSWQNQVCRQFSLPTDSTDPFYRIHSIASFAENRDQRTPCLRRDT